MNWISFQYHDQCSIYRALSTPEAWVLNINFLLLLLSCIISLLPPFMLFSLYSPSLVLCRSLWSLEVRIRESLLLPWHNANLAVCVKT